MQPQQENRFAIHRYIDRKPSAIVISVHGRQGYQSDVATIYVTGPGEGSLQEALIYSRQFKRLGSAGTPGEKELDSIIRLLEKSSWAAQLIAPSGMYSRGMISPIADILRRGDSHGLPMTTFDLERELFGIEGNAQGRTRELLRDYVTRYHPEFQ